MIQPLLSDDVLFDKFMKSICMSRSALSQQYTPEEKNHLYSVFYKAKEFLAKMIAWKSQSGQLDGSQALSNLLVHNNEARKELGLTSR